MSAQHRQEVVRAVGKLGNEFTSECGIDYPFLCRSALVRFLSDLLNNNHIPDLQEYARTTWSDAPSEVLERDPADFPKLLIAKKLPKLCDIAGTVSTIPPGPVRAETLLHCIENVKEKNGKQKKAKESGKSRMAMKQKGKSVHSKKGLKDKGKKKK